MKIEYTQTMWGFVDTVGSKRVKPKLVGDDESGYPMYSTKKEAIMNAGTGENVVKLTITYVIER
jgi:hypothetical protein